MTTTTDPARSGATPVLRRLYLARSVFALAWAALLFATASGIGAVSATLLVLYPLVDVAAAVVDSRSSRPGGVTGGLRVNAAVSALAAVGLALALGSGVPAVLRVWGAWAVAAGLAQLVVALRRRALGGQWAMIASGSLSVLAGASFVLMASGDGASLSGVAGYAALGGVFFLVSALRLGRTARGAAQSPLS
jgi:uncharacterized membrane protein HdeD (DUF308 family)